MSHIVNLLTDEGMPQAATGLQRVKISESETPVYPFAASGELISLHYLDDEELGYVPCGGKGCVLCAIGLHRTEHVLLPVYNPSTGAVEVLLASTSQRPGSLLPPLKAILKAGRPVVVFLTRNGKKFTVSSGAIPADADHGESAIAAFNTAYAAKEFKLESVFPVYDADLLKELPSVKSKRKIKGLE